MNHLQSDGAHDCADHAEGPEEVRGQPAHARRGPGALQGYTSYFGRFTVDEAGKFVTHHQDGMLNPNGVGGDAKRFFQLDGTRLTLQPPSTTNSNGETVTQHLTWTMLPHAH